MKKILLFSLLLVLALLSTSCGTSAYKNDVSITSIDYNNVMDRIELDGSVLYVISADVLEKSSNYSSDEDVFQVSYRVEVPIESKDDVDFEKVAYLGDIVSKNDTVYTSFEQSIYYGGYVAVDTGEKGTTITTDMSFSIPKDEKIEFLNFVTLTSKGDVIKVKVN